MSLGGSVTAAAKSATKAVVRASAPKSRLEHEGRLPQPGIPAGPRNTAPVVTVSPSGQTQAYNYSSPAAAKQAVRATQQRLRASERRTKAIVQLTKPKAQKASQPVSPLIAKYTGPKANPGKQKQLETKAYLKPQPTSKPVTFQGKKTAGTPTLAELQTAAQGGTLKVNQKGFATTPTVRKTAGTVKRLKAKAQKSNAPLPGLDRQESHVARKVLSTGRSEHVGPKKLLAASETGLVESGFKNLPGGDADSQGWRQERTSIFGTGPQGPRNVKASAKRFYSEAPRAPGSTAGEVAQAAQGSAFPERYDEHKPQAAAILKAFQKGGLKPAQQAKLAAATQEAKELGLKVGGRAAGPAPKQVVTRYKAGLKAMGELEKAHLPYVWGGGHNAGKVNPGSGLDCSGTVSYVLQHMGVKLPGGVVSGDMGQYLAPGPGAVTVFYNGEHTFMRVGNKYFGTSESNPGGGAGFFPKSVGNSEVASGNADGSYSVGHVPGLGKKQALQLGINVGSTGGTQPFPGMTLSSSGTSASIDPGAGATESKPGFSQRPIKLTLGQRVGQTKRKLRALGVGVKAPEETSTTLSALEKKYGHAAV
jgi:cell wall-associated NlpC family hydrolase